MGGEVDLIFPNMGIWILVFRYGYIRKYRLMHGHITYTDKITNTNI